MPGAKHNEMMTKTVESFNFLGFETHTEVPWDFTGFSPILGKKIKSYRIDVVANNPNFGTIFTELGNCSDEKKTFLINASKVLDYRFIHIPYHGKSIITPLVSINDTVRDHSGLICIRCGRIVKVSQFWDRTKYSEGECVWVVNHCTKIDHKIGGDCHIKGWHKTNCWFPVSCDELKTHPEFLKALRSMYYDKHVGAE